MSWAWSAVNPSDEARPAQASVNSVGFKFVHGRALVSHKINQDHEGSGISPSTLVVSPAVLFGVIPESDLRLLRPVPRRVSGLELRIDLDEQR